MITFNQALGFNNIKSPEKLSPPVLTDEELVIFDQADSVIESVIFKHFDGRVLNIDVPVVIPANIMEALRIKYEEGGWSVGVIPISDDKKENIRVWHFVLSPGHLAEQVQRRTDDLVRLPPVSQMITTGGPTRRILVRMPTRGRPAQALRVLNEYRQRAGVQVAIEVVVDEDDESMLSTQVLQRLNALGCIVTTGIHKTKVEAVNGGRVREWDILVLASDDMVPIQDGWAFEVLHAMEKHFPYLDGCVFFDDGYAHERCVTLPIMGRRLWEQFGHVYAPQYKSLWVDMEQTNVLSAMGRLAYVDKPIIEHRHPVTRKADRDALYERNDALEGADRELYETRGPLTREHAQWGFDSPPMWLSIMIATTSTRRSRLDLLLEHLHQQTLRNPREIELIVDSGEGNIGEKRQRMLERTRGHFVCAIDDDDMVPHNYCDRILEVIKRDPMVDCLSLNGVMTSDGERPERFEHSIKFDGWYTKNRVHYRTPNHLSPIRREHAIKAGFQPKAFGEDHTYSESVRPYLQKEGDTGDSPLYFYWVRTKSALGE